MDRVNLLGGLFKTAFTPVKAAWKVGTKPGWRGLALKTGAGAVVGGVAGAAGGYDINDILEGAAKGAVLGGVAGAAFHLGPRAAFGWRSHAMSAQARSMALQRARQTTIGKGAGPVSKLAYDTALREVQTEGYRVGGLVQKAWKGGKHLWYANREAGVRAASKRARMTAFGSLDVQGPLTEDLAREAASLTTSLAASPAGRMVGMGGKAGQMAMRHPLATGGAIIGGSYLLGGPNVGQPMTSPALEGSMMNVSYNEQAIRATEMGSIGMGTIGTPQDMLPRFQYADWMSTTGRFLRENSRLGRMAGSTVGLTQGLHAGRHG